MAINAGEASALTTNPVTSIDWGSQIRGTSSAGGTVTYSFGSAGTSTTFTEELGLGVSITGEAFTAYERDQFRAALDLIADVTNLTFQETNNYSSADLRFLVDTNEFTALDLGIMSPPGELGAGIGLFNAAFWDRGPGGDLEEGGFSFVTIVHEILHGMGLAHPHDFGGTSGIMAGVTSGFDDFGNHDLNQGIYTTMTYNTGQLTPSGIGALSTGFIYGHEAGPMALDIAVLQDKYGVNENHAAGNNTYYLPRGNGSGTYWSSIWDTGGTDMIRYNGGRDVTIDLRAATLQSEEGGGGFLSAANGVQGGFTIANGVIIERAHGGNGDDRLVGNSADNLLIGARGRDGISGGGGDDTLRGSGGRDTLAGGGGDDLLDLGRGSDRGVGQGGTDVLNGGRGNDELVGGSGDDRLNGSFGNDVLRGGKHDDVLNGGNGSDRLSGQRDNDTLNGGRGSDELNGGGNNDVLNGGRGHDVLYGGRGNDVMRGGGADDTMNGGSGADVLNGGRGDDVMHGGGGRDTFIFNNRYDRDEIRDFDVNQDSLRIDADLLNGQTTGQAVISAFGSSRGGDLVLNFGGGDVLRLDGISAGQFDAVAAQIEIF